MIPYTRFRFGKVPLLLVFLFLIVLVWKSRNYLAQESNVVVDDATREERRWSVMSASLEFQLRTLQLKYHSNECSSTDSTYTWLTFVDSQLATVQAIVLGSMLNKLSCIANKLVIVTDAVGKEGRNVLTRAGFLVKSVPALNCNSSRRVEVIQMWGDVEFDKIVFIDPTLFPLLAVDEIFDSVSPGTISSPYCHPPGVLQPCLNPSLLAFQPSTALHFKLVDKFQRSSCPSLDTVLWDVFVHSNKWNKLSYSYNVKETRYFPMKMFDMGGASRLGPVWKWSEKPTRQEADITRLSNVQDIYRLWWNVLYHSLEEHDLWFWWHDSDVYKKFLHSDPLRDYRAVDIW